MWKGQQMYLKNKSDYFILRQKIENTILLSSARECLSETVGFTLGETLFKSKAYGSRIGTIQKYFANPKKYFKSQCFFFKNRCRRVCQI